METGIIVLIALVLGYSQGIKKKRKKEGKKGGVFSMLGERFTKKGRLIKEQEQQIFELKDEILGLQRQKEERQANCYSKGNNRDLQKSLFLFLWDNENLRENCIKCYFYINILFENIYDIKEEKYSSYGLRESFAKVEEKIGNDYVPSLKTIKKINYAFDFTEIKSGAKDFLSKYNNYNFDVTLEDFNNALKIALEK